MTGFLVACCAVFGLAIGSFLNVVIWRVPRSESVVRPASACPGCGNEIRPWDNIPVVSWLALRGRCRSCGTRISVRYPLVELGTALAFAAAAAWFGTEWMLPAFLYLAAISIALSMIDIDVKRLPDAIVKPSYLVAAALLALAAVLAGSPEALLRASIGGLAMFALYFAIVFAYPRGMGWGDVKLAGLLGMFLGFLGWKELATGAFLAFCVGGLVGIVLIAAGQRQRKIPFGPYMFAGAWLGILVGPVIADWYLQVAQLA